MIRAHTTQPRDPQPLHGGNVYFPTAYDQQAADADDRHELLVIGAMAGITLLAGLIGGCVILGWGWAQLRMLLA